MTTQTAKATGQTLKQLPDNKVIRLHNVVCPYCAKALTKETTTKEHVVGRRFVPKGKLNNEWNLIVNACGHCNGKKSDLEDDISAITLQPDIFGRFAHEDETVAADGQKKASKSFSRRTGMKVEDSQEKMSINVPYGSGVNISFDFTGPPQIEPSRIYELTRLQLAAFFFWITYKEDEKRGYWWPGGYYPIFYTNRSDWGNPVHIAFADAVVDWEPRVFATNADGFFKIALRKHPKADCWSWALEWNHAKRVIGFCGNEDATRAIASQFPQLEFQMISQEPNGTIRSRIEVPIGENDDDKLFYWEGSNGQS